VHLGGVCRGYIYGQRKLVGRLPITTPGEGYGKEAIRVTALKDTQPNSSIVTTVQGRRQVILAVLSFILNGGKYNFTTYDE
jgi:hypothetical protein